MNAPNELLLGILSCDELEIEFISQFQYVLSHLKLKIRVIVFSDIKDVFNINALLILNDNVDMAELYHICKNIFLISNSSNELLQLSDNRLHIISYYNPSYVLLQIIKIFIKLEYLNIGDLILAAVTLIEIVEARQPNFISECIANDKLAIKKSEFKNISTLYMAGKFNDFRPEFCVAVDGGFKITMNLRRYHFLQIDRLRFHPHNKHCIIHSCQFSVNYEDGETVVLEDYIMNNSFVEDGKYYFIAQAPQIDFSPLLRINPISFDCVFKIEDIEETKYFRKPGSIYEIREHYKSLVDAELTGGFWVKGDKNHNIFDKSPEKNIFIFLGPKCVGLEDINDYLLNNVSSIIHKKMFYPTHQREFYNKSGSGSLYSLFSRKSESVVIFDERKANALKKDLYDSNFNTLILASEDFLIEDRLLYCKRVFESAKYIYYLRDCVEFEFEKYKVDLYFNNETRKFKQTIWNQSHQVKYFFSILKYLTPENLLLKPFILEYYKTQNRVGDDLLQILGFPIDEKPQRDFKAAFNLFNISDIALEFRRLINFYRIIDEQIKIFLQKALLEYKNGICSYIWLTESENKIYKRCFNDSLRVIFTVFSYNEGLEVLSQVEQVTDNFTEQEITREDILDIMQFLKQRDSDIFQRLIIELKLSENVTTDNDIFNTVIAEI